MGNRFTELLGRLRDFRSRVGSNERATQITAASIVLAVALIGVTLRSGAGSVNAARVGDASRSTGAVTGRGPTASIAPGARSGRSVVGSGTASGTAGIGPGNTANAPSGVNARGISDTEILVGAVYDETAGELNEAYGIAGIGQIDQRAAIEHVRDYINGHGGIGGRKIKIVWYVFNELSNKSPETVAQEACTTWTQQNHVFTVLAGYGGLDTLNRCLTKAGVVQVDIGTGLADAKSYRDYPYLVDLDYPAIDRLARLSVDELYGLGFYGKSRTDQPRLPFKLGVMSYDDPVFDRAIEVLRASLGAHDVKLSVVRQVHRAETPNDIADETAQIGQAVLRFKSQNVTHVQFLATTSSFEQSTFWQQADHQRYYPRYGLTSIDAAQALVASLNGSNGDGAAARVFKEAVGVGWLPLSDVPLADYPPSKEQPALRLCKQILSYERWDDPSRYKETVAGWTCDSAFYLKAAVEGAGRVVNTKTWLEAVASADPPSAVTFRMSTTATRHDAMAATRTFRFHDACACFHYSSGLKPV